MNFPIPDLGEFAAGFATCGAVIVAAVVARHVIPKFNAMIVKTEGAAKATLDAFYAEYKAAISAVDTKVAALANAAGSAVNAIRGDVGGLQTGMAYLEDRIFTLEKAVGISDPTQDPKAPPAPVKTVGHVQTEPPAF